MRLTPKMVGEGTLLLPSDMCPEIEISSVLGARRSNDLVVLPALICRGVEKHGGDKKKVETMRAAERGDEVKRSKAEGKMLRGVSV